MPTVSVCLPVYNGEKYLAQAIESVLAQTWADYELLIGDDCSQDGSPDIIEKYSRKDSRIVAWSNEKNLGLFANYNACLQRASGSYIKPFAQDDLLMPDMLSRVLSAFTHCENVALVSTHRVTIDENGCPRQINAQMDSSRIVSGDEAIKGCLIKLYNWIGEPSAVMFPRRNRGTGFDSTLYHLGDLEYWFRILAHGNYVYLNEPLCQFRFHEGGTTTGNMKALFFLVDALRIGRMYRQHLHALGVEERDFVRDVLRFASFVAHNLSTEQGLTSEQSATIPIRDADMEMMLKQFRELAFLSLSYSFEELAKLDAAKKHIENDLASNEQRLKSLHDDPIAAVGRLLKEAVAFR